MGQKPLKVIKKIKKPYYPEPGYAWRSYARRGDFADWDQILFEKITPEAQIQYRINWFRDERQTLTFLHREHPNWPLYSDD